MSSKNGSNASQRESIPGWPARFARAFMFCQLVYAPVPFWPCFRLPYRFTPGSVQRLNDRLHQSQFPLLLILERGEFGEGEELEGDGG